MEVAWRPSAPPGRKHVSKQAEREYLRNLGEAGAWHSLNKPFSDPNCSRYLQEIGAILSLLPAPPGRLLDIGCGAGWTSVFFARRGYDVVGVDISPDMIEWAEKNRKRYGLENLTFAVCDFEQMAFRDEFDCVVFFDSLHHAEDERAALEKVYLALRPGGVCVASEPGHGHSSQPASVEATSKFGVAERDMPPSKIAAAAQSAGFEQFDVFPHAFDVLQIVYGAMGTSGDRNALIAKYRREFESTVKAAPLSGVVRMAKVGPGVEVQSGARKHSASRWIRHRIRNLLCRLLWD